MFGQRLLACAPLDLTLVVLHVSSSILCLSFTYVILISDRITSAPGGHEAIGFSCGPMSAARQRYCIIQQVFEGCS